MQGYKQCPRCQTAAYPNQPFCANCGFSYVQQPAYTNQPPYIQHPAVEPNISMIIAMWVLTAGVFIFAQTDRSLSLILDIPAFVMAILLFRTRSNANRINGGIKLGLELLALLLALCGNPQTTQSPIQDNRYPSYILPQKQKQQIDEKGMTPLERQLHRVDNI